MAQILDLGKLRFNWTGAWDSATTYEFNDVVTYGANVYIYIATANTSNVLPTDSGFWALVTEGIRYRGTYTSTTEYLVNDIVIDGLNTYIVTANHTAATPAVALEAEELTIIALGQEGLPSQSGNINKILTTDGSSVSWTATARLTKTYVGTSQGESASDFETTAVLTDTAAVFAKSTTDFGQLAMVNPSNGANASADVIVYTADGTNDSGWIDLGITSNDFDAETFGITGPHDGYIFMSAPRGTTFDVSYKQVVATTATLTTTVSHGYSVGDQIRLENVGSGLDGIHTLTAASTTSLSFTTNVVPFSNTALSPFGLVYKPKGDGNLVLATDLTGISNKIVFAAGGFSNGTSQMEITANEVVDITIDTESTSNTTGALTVAGGAGFVKNVHVGGDLQTDSILYVGPEADNFTVTANLNDPIAVLVYEGSPSSYAQVAIHNSEPTSSTDILLYADNGDDATGWIDFGITGSEFDQAEYGLTGPNDGYLFYEAPAGTTGAGNLVIATGDQGSENAIIFGAGGFASGQTQMAIYPGVNVHIEIDTPSTSPTTGALTIVGGVGITGDVNIAGSITFGGEGTQLTSENLAVTAPLIFTGDSSTSSAYDLGIITEGKYTVTNIPVATVINKELNTNVATLTTLATHNFAVGDSVAVASVDATFNGTYTITAVDEPNKTFSYAKTAGNVSSAAIGQVNYTVTNKALNTNVATLTTSVTHAMTIGTTVFVTGVDSTFNGTYTITAVTTNTFSYAKTASNVTSVSASGTATYYTSTSTATVSSATRTRWNGWTKDATDSVWKLVSNISTKPSTTIDYDQNTYGNGADIVYDSIKVKNVVSTGNVTVSGTEDVTGNFSVNTNKFTVIASSGNTAVAGTLDSTGNFAVNTNKFTVAASSGNTLVAGTLDSTGNFAVNTNKFTVTASSGNTSVAGTLSSTGDFAVNTNKFNVTASSGNTTVAGTLGVTGKLTVTGGITSTGTTEVQELRESVVDVTLSGGTTGTLDWTAGNIYYIATAPTGAMTLNVTNVPTDTSYMYTINVFVTQGSTGYIPTTFQIAGVSQTIKWSGGSAPSATSSAGKIDIFSFTMQRTSGGSWLVYGVASSNF